MAVCAIYDDRSFGSQLVAPLGDLAGLAPHRGRQHALVIVEGAASANIDDQRRGGGAESRVKFSGGNGKTAVIHDARSSTSEWRRLGRSAV
jgi:hypothetical protein